MNGCRSLLVQLGILAIPVCLFLATWWICDSVFGLVSPIPMLIAVVTLILGFVGFFWWMIALQREEDEVLSTVDHPFFGTVNQKQKSWEASLTVPNIGTDIAVSSYEGDTPTRNQEEIVQWLSNSVTAIRDELEGCLDEFDHETNTLPPRPRKLVFESLLLDPSEPKTFCLGFDIEDADLPWGFSAFYTAGQIEEFTDNH